MAVTVVVGAQYGGEGKGKIVAHLALRDNADFVVRCGGPNSGHTVYFGNKIYKPRLLPAGFVNPRSRLLLAAGCIINPRILLDEIEQAGIDPKRVGVDRNAVIITEQDSEAEQELGLRTRIGSTLSGTGAGVIKRIMRDGSAVLASETIELKDFITDVSQEINNGINQGKHCIVEGTQGFGLSLYHTSCYPYATSRDTTASGFLSEVGLSPRLVTAIVMCVRTYPIRVEGNSGPLKDEITWQRLRKLSGYPRDVSEFTTVTGRLRRIAMFDIDFVNRAVMVNKPTEIALHGADYLDFANQGRSDYQDLTTNTKKFIEDLENITQVQVSIIGTGPEQQEILDRGKQLRFLSSSIGR